MLGLTSLSNVIGASFGNRSDMVHWSAFLFCFFSSPVRKGWFAKVDNGRAWFPFLACVICKCSWPGRALRSSLAQASRCDGDWKGDGRGVSSACYDLLLKRVVQLITVKV